MPGRNLAFQVPPLRGDARTPGLADAELERPPRELARKGLGSGRQGGPVEKGPAGAGEQQGLPGSAEDTSEGNRFG